MKFINKHTTKVDDNPNNNANLFFNTRLIKNHITDNNNSNPHIADKTRS